VRGVAIADTADDGFPDVIVVSDTGTATSLQILNLVATTCTGEVFTTQTGANAFIAARRRESVVADVDGDAVMDLSLATPNTFLTWIGHVQGGLARGFVSAPQVLSTAFKRAGVADIDRDGTADIVGLAGNGNALLVAHGRQQDVSTPRTFVVDASHSIGLTLRASDSFGATFAPRALWKRYDGFGRWDEQAVVDFAAAAAGEGRVTAGLRGLTRPHEAGGLTYLLRDDASGRYSVQAAYPDADAAANRGVIFDLPIAPARWGLDLSTGVSVVFRADDFVHADVHPGDPLFGTPQGATVLPLGRDGDSPFVHRSSAWETLTRDADGDFATDTGRRFIVENTGTTHRVRVLLDRPGVVQAFVQ
jgi:hypothetical protein